jgi:hypothetical protein
VLTRNRRPVFQEEGLMKEKIKLIFPEEPVWEPLHQVIEEKERERFMFMGQATLPEGLTIHLYKHIWTRRYINLSVGKDGIQAHSYRAGDYIPVSLDEALKQVFG